MSGLNVRESTRHTAGMLILRVQEWANRTGLSAKTLKRAIGAGHLHARRLGNGPTTPYFVTEADFDRWLESRLVPRKAWQGARV